jgi:hypothetical protein
MDLKLAGRKGFILGPTVGIGLARPVSSGVGTGQDDKDEVK